jgi:large subunit ribosomal protein L25
MQSVSLVGQRRTDLGKKASNDLRKSGSIPCTIYGGKENVNFSAPYNSFKNIIFTDKFMKVAIDVDGAQHEALVQSTQFHPVSDRITHIDFLELTPGKKIVVDIPVRVSGFAKGVQAGGKLEQKLKKIRVKVAVESMIDEIHLDITDLDMGKSIKVKDLNYDGIEMLTAANNPVVAISIPRAARGAAAADAAAKK